MGAPSTNGRSAPERPTGERSIPDRSRRGCRSAGSRCPPRRSASRARGTRPPSVGRTAAGRTVPSPPCGHAAQGHHARRHPERLACQRRAVIWERIEGYVDGGVLGEAFFVRAAALDFDSVGRVSRAHRGRHSRSRRAVPTSARPIIARGPGFTHPNSTARRRWTIASASRIVWWSGNPSRLRAPTPATQARRTGRGWGGVSEAGKVGLVPVETRRTIHYGAGPPPSSVSQLVPVQPGAQVHV